MSPVVGLIGPCWMQHPRRRNCVYWVGPHVLGPGTHDIGQGWWMQNGEKQYMPPPKGCRICANPYVPVYAFENGRGASAPTAGARGPGARSPRSRIGELQLSPTSSQITEALDGKVWPWTSWVEWYNRGATSVQQEKFDRITKVLDSGGAEYMQGGGQQDYIDAWRFTEPDIYKALVYYRDTGGRRALFAKETPSYGDKPISAVKPDGPITKNSAGQIILHPGRYTYSAVQAQGQAFHDWLYRNVAARDAQILKTQASEEASWLASLYGMSPTSVLGPGILYIDYEFLIAKDLVWDTSIHGLPSWLPKNVDVTSYWGKPTPHAKPSIEELKKLAEGATDALKGLASIAALGVVGYLLFLLAGSSRGSARTATV